jgi:serine phosphatase RsbU (regulator of sigma subunit)
LYPDKEYTDKKIQIEKGDRIILYTDGITELQDSEKKQLGLAGFKNYIRETKAGSTKEFVKELEKKIKNYKGEIAQNDDITLFVIQY